MNYFFIPNFNNNLKSQLTLSNFSSNTLDKNIKQKVRILYRVYIQNQKWIYEKISSISPNDYFIVTDEIHKNSNNPDHTFYCLSENELGGEYDELIVSNELHTIPEWRSNIKISNENISSSSYQGDYSPIMTKFVNSTLLSLSPMFQSDENIKTKIIFTNIIKDPVVKEGEIKLFTIKEQKFLCSVKYKTNTVNVIDIPENVNEKYIAIMSNSHTGVPIFFTHNKDFSCMSLEHTHPPGSMTIFGEYYKIQNKVKTWWLKKF